MKKLSWLIVVVIMLSSIFPNTAFAEDNNPGDDSVISIEDLDRLFFDFNSVQFDGVVNSENIYNIIRHSVSKSNLTSQKYEYDDHGDYNWFKAEDVKTAVLNTFALDDIDLTEYEYYDFENDWIRTSVGWGGISTPIIEKQEYRDNEWHIEASKDIEAQKLFLTLNNDLKVVSCHVINEFSGGIGVEEDPYLIETKYHLNNVRNHLDAHFKMIADIEFTNADFVEGGDFYNNGNGWTPIGTNDTPFRGSFDGNNHGIKSLYMNYTNTTLRYFGLFGRSVGNVVNVSLTDVNYNINSCTSKIRIGGIVGSFNDVYLEKDIAISNCRVNGVINVSNTNEAIVGGIVGLSQGASKKYYKAIISECVSNCIITCDSALAEIGGIAGDIRYYVDILNCRNTGNITLESIDTYTNRSLFVGGIVGYAYSLYGNISYCCNTATIYGKALSRVEDNVYVYSGGILGYDCVSSGVIQYCYNTGKIVAETEGKSSLSLNCYAYAGGICGHGYWTKMNDCYNVGEVYANSRMNESDSFAHAYAGGITGYSFNDRSLQNLYNIGTVKAKAVSVKKPTSRFVTEYGGIIGKWESHKSVEETVKNCYWLNNTFHGIYSKNETATTKCSFEQLLNKETFSSFNFDTVWSMSGNTNYKFPVLTENRMSLVKKELIWLELAAKPSKNFYCSNEKFDPTGLIVNAYYTDGSREVIADYLVSGYSSTAGEKNIVITYDKRSVDFKVFVISKHDYVGDYIYNNDATYSADGTKTRTCSICGYKDTVAAEGTKLEKQLVDSSKKFTDVKASAWYKPYIDYAVTYKLLNGTGDGKMDPERTITRAEFVQVLANLSGIDTGNKNVKTHFTDVKSGDWYAPAVKWANENGIVNGVSLTEFAPEEKITREQMCTMLVRYAENFLKITLDQVNTKKTFADDKKISDWAKDSVYKCQQSGLVGGVSATEFAPLDSADRAAVATIMTRFHKQYI